MKHIRLHSLVLLMSLLYFGTANGQTPGPNIILIVFDDLNDYAQGFGGNAAAFTPNLLALEQKGTSFMNAFTNAPVCAPSRASMLTGKLPDYTGIYQNEEYISENFRDNFPPGKLIITLPQWLKDSAGYYTYNIDKILHCDTCDAQHPDFDDATADPCSRELSWNQQTNSGDDPTVPVEQRWQGLPHLAWGAIDSSQVAAMPDFRTANTALEFINNYAAYPSQFCDRPFFLAIGIRKPHSNLYIPEQYFNDKYISNFYQSPFEAPYFNPAYGTDADGIPMPPQPQPEWSDYDNAAELSHSMMNTYAHDEFISWPVDSLDPLPVINDGLTDSERIIILSESKRANAVMAYLAAMQFADEQLGKVIDQLSAYPEIYNNTVIIVTSDHGFSLGEKKHWGKGTLWETDIRVPLIIADLRNIHQQQSWSPVDAVDIFPTVCDIAGVEYPKFPAGENYPDGKSLLTMMQDPDLYFDQPVLTQVKDVALYCYPQNSVRTARWHYIRYTSNNAGGVSGCDSLQADHQEELYEIGRLRDVDPYEWNNLSAQEGYGPLMQYLQQFLPDSALYEQPVGAVIIHSDLTDCMAGYDASFELSATVFGVSGVMISSPADSGYSVEWSNNITAEKHTGFNYIFDMATVSKEAFLQHDRIIFNCKVKNAAGQIMAFDIFYVFINNAYLPDISYDIRLEDMTATVGNIQITGSYHSVQWDFGDGTVSDKLWPETHHYSLPGNYTIKNLISYGNNCSLLSEKNITLPTSLNSDAFEMLLFPDPATTVLHIMFSQLVSNARVTITDITGKKIMEQELSSSTGNAIDISIENWPHGIYVFSIVAKEGVHTALFEKY